MYRMQTQLQSAESKFWQLFLDKLHKTEKYNSCNHFLFVTQLILIGLDFISVLLLFFFISEID